MDKAYHIYLTDCLKAIADNELKYFTRNPQVEALTKRFADILFPKEDESKSAVEIANDIMGKAGLSFERGTEE